MTEKGECFKNVFQYVLDNSTDSMVVVHGEVSKRDGTPIKHAWLEDGNIVIEPTFVIAGRDIKWGKDEYYEKLHAKPEAKYHTMDAIGLATRNKHYGPWTPEEQRGKNMIQEEKEPKIDPKELKVGSEVEKEHTKNPKGSKKIATQHLKEPGHEKYYTNLNKCGLIDEPKAKQLAKKFLVNERQFKLISESVMNEAPLDFVEGDVVQLLAPVEGYDAPVQTPGKVMHVDAIGTIRVEFNVNGNRIIVPVNPEIDQIIKVTPQGSAKL